MKNETQTAKHTPGPWSLAYGENGKLELGGNGDLHTSVISESGFGIIAQVLFKKSNILGDSKKLQEETFEANARLIAAAPDMLTALTIIKDLKEMDLVRFESDDDYQTVLTAIEKATNNQNTTL